MATARFARVWSSLVNTPELSNNSCLNIDRSFEYFDIHGITHFGIFRQHTIRYFTYKDIF